jgi:predicted small lipoprotein YifL
VRWIILLLLTMQVATCGQKGPLTLPDGSSPHVAVDIADRP